MTFIAGNAVSVNSLCMNRDNRNWKKNKESDYVNFFLSSLSSIYFIFYSIIYLVSSRNINYLFMKLSSHRPIISKKLLVVKLL